MDLLNQVIDGYLHVYRQTCMLVDRPYMDLFNVTFDKSHGSIWHCADKLYFSKRALRFLVDVFEMNDDFK